jgi:hypothetical protein
MSRKFMIAIAAVAALGMSTLAATDASARFGGGGGGGFRGGGHASFSRTSFSPARVTTNRVMTRTVRTPHVSRTTHFRPNTHRPNPHYAQHRHYHHGHHWWAWCRHHHGYRCGYPWIDVGVDGGAVDVVADAPQAIAATPAAVCNDCDYFLKDEPGCYMAKRAFSTPAGDELRCVKICEEPQHAAK